MKSLKEVRTQLEELPPGIREGILRILMERPDMAEETLKELPKILRIERGRASLETFARTYLPHMMPQATPDWHLDLDSLIERMYIENKQGVIVAAPRGFGKTARLGQFRALHAALYKRHRFIVVIGSSEDRAQLLLQPIKQELETNALIREDFGDLEGDKYDPAQVWNSSTLTLTWPHRSGEKKKTARGSRPKLGDIVTIAARGAGSALRGLRVGSERPSLLILDDTEVDESVSTPLQREKMWQWLTAEVIPMLDPVSGKLIVIGTILHSDSMLSRLLKDDRHYLTATYRALGKDNTSLWPERFSAERLMEIRDTIGPRVFAQEYQNLPYAAGAQIFRPEWFRPYTRGQVVWHDGSWYFGEKPLRIFQAIDPAISDAVDADFFAAVTIGVTEDRDIVVMDAFAKRGMDFPSQVDFVKSYYESFLPQRVGIEDVHYQRALRQEVLRRESIPIRPIKVGPKTSKYERITSTDVHFANGKVFIRQAQDYEEGQVDPTGTLDWRIHSRVFPLFEQLIQYPSGAHDKEIVVFKLRSLLETP